jgi:hypothetical protein
MQCTEREEALCNTSREEQVEDQVSKFLHCCLKLLSDPDVAKKLTHMLTRCMGEEEIMMAIYTPLPERDMCQVSKHKCIGDGWGHVGSGSRCEHPAKEIMGVDE